MSAVPLSGNSLKLVNEGCIPGAAFTNLEYAETDTFFSDNLNYNLKMIAFDAQTSGGLLISVNNLKAEELLKDLRSAGLLMSSIIGKVTSRREKLLYLTD